MAKNTVLDYDQTAANNTDIQGKNIAEGCDAANLNDALRELMADIAVMIAGGLTLTALKVAALTMGTATATALSAAALSGTTGTFTHVAATTVSFGGVALGWASQAQAEGGTATGVLMDPLLSRQGVQALVATEAAAGVVRLATVAQVKAATATATAISPLNLKQHPAVVAFEAYVTISGGVATLAYGYNITSATRTAQGVLTLVIANDMATASYIVHVNCTAATDTTIRKGAVSNSVAQAAGSVRLACTDGDNQLQDPVAWHVTGYGVLA